MPLFLQGVQKSLEQDARLATISCQVRQWKFQKFGMVFLGIRYLCIAVPPRILLSSFTSEALGSMVKSDAGYFSMELGRAGFRVESDAAGFNFKLDASDFSVVSDAADFMLSEMQQGLVWSQMQRFQGRVRSSEF